MPFDSGDRTILRDLATRVAEIASLPVMAARRSMWKKHNALERVRPMILVFPEGSWRELLPTETLACKTARAREMEWELRRRLYCHEHIPDDAVVEREWAVDRPYKVSGWGLEPISIPSSQDTGAVRFEPVICTSKDLRKLRCPEVTVNGRSNLMLDEVQELLGDILDVRERGVRCVSFHMMSVYCRLRGHANVMMDMLTEPEWLHEAMSFLANGYSSVLKQWQALNLLDLNNDGTYHSSGGVGYTNELPRPGYNPERIEPCDMWASAEAQELAGVSPELHEEFALQYERRLLGPFGLNGYGCCEDLTQKLDLVLSIPNIRRVSISPFADVERCAEKLQAWCIFSWKPHPAHLVGHFDEPSIRAYIRRALEMTTGCVVEMILKDTHTCESRPERFTRWTRMARELAEQF